MIQEQRGLDCAEDLPPSTPAHQFDVCASRISARAACRAEISIRKTKTRIFSCSAEPSSKHPIKQVEGEAMDWGRLSSGESPGLRPCSFLRSCMDGNPRVCEFSDAPISLAIP